MLAPAASSTCLAVPAKHATPATRKRDDGQVTAGHETDRPYSRHEIAGQEIAGHEITGHENSGHENERHEIARNLLFCM